MNGAQAMIRTLVDSDVDVCFMNPGTSEMHFVHALDSVPEMRGVLALFEGVATGAADGYARMADRPAGVLLHLGPGLGNGLANLHNARRAKSPVLNIVGDHATYHAKYDAPLQSDIASIARGVSEWIRTVRDPESLARDTADAVAAAFGPPGQVATLIVPADTCWLDSPGPVGPSPRKAPAEVDSDRIEDLAAILRSDEPAALLLGGTAVRGAALRDAARIGRASGARILGETFPNAVRDCDDDEAIAAHHVDDPDREARDPARPGASRDQRASVRHVDRGHDRVMRRDQEPAPTPGAFRS